MAEDATFDSPEFCYHRHRRSTVDIFGTTAVKRITCLDCGATVEAGYNAPLPDMPPMPFGGCSRGGPPQEAAS